MNSNYYISLSERKYNIDQSMFLIALSHFVIILLLMNIRSVFKEENALMPYSIHEKDWETGK